MRRLLHALLVAPIVTCVLGCAATIGWDSYEEEPAVVTDGGTLDGRGGDATTTRLDAADVSAPDAISGGESGGCTGNRCVDAGGEEANDAEMLADVETPDDGGGPESGTDAGSCPATIVQNPACSTQGASCVLGGATCVCDFGYWSCGCPAIQPTEYQPCEPCEQCTYGSTVCACQPFGWYCMVY